MKSIELTQGRTAIVDDEVYPVVTRWKWHVNSEGYVAAKLPKARHEGKLIQARVYLHRWVLESYYNIRVGGLQVDHVNGDKLDNRIENLRVVTSQQNQFNAKRRSTNTSGYKGVSFDRYAGKYRSQLWYLGKKYHLGCFDTAEDAAQAYNVAAIEYHGEYARLNEVS